MFVYLNIGSNKGDRKAHIERAVAFLRLAYPHATLRLSDDIESEPWGYDSPNRFINIGVALDFDVMPGPLDLLHTLQLIERLSGTGSHRNADGSYRDREVDIDIIEIDGYTLQSPQLTIPHPRAHLRDFVMIPLAQLKQAGN